MTIPDPLAAKSDSIALASKIHSAWDNAWPKIEREITSQGLDILCEESCHICCFAPKPCSECESLLIAKHLREEFLPELQEHFRSRLESTAASLRKLRAQGYCDSADILARTGGLECPFLQKGRCAIYSVRPLACRSMVVGAPKDDRALTSLCLQCPGSAICLEAEVKRAELQEAMDEQEPPTTVHATIAERLSSLWQREESIAATDTITPTSWKVRLESRDSAFDQTWRDDGFDWRVIATRVVLPEEGEYPPDIVVLRVNPETHEVYGETVRANLAELRVLYKLLPGGSFNWEQRQFRSKQNKDSHIVWMGDSIQERLMMWEAAKRCRGRVLCGGLGLGIFPQFAMGFPRVDSLHVVEIDTEIISLIESTWAKSTWPRQSECSISQSSIETFLKETHEKFDTVYIDTWDALTFDYLPHINCLKELARKTLNPGGEILLWGYDSMVRYALGQAKHILSRREYFLAANDNQLNTLEHQQPFFHKMLQWLLCHQDCAADEFYTATYRLATSWQKDLGRLSLDRLG